MTYSRSRRGEEETESGRLLLTMHYRHSPGAESGKNLPGESVAGGCTCLEPQGAWTLPHPKQYMAPRSRSTRPSLGVLSPVPLGLVHI